MNYGATLKSAVRHKLDPISVLELWSSGMDTNDIARALVCSEPEVYNIMALMRGQAA